MGKLSVAQRKVIADFLANIGVAWFAAGVIGAFLSSPKNILELIIPLIWGISFSAGFLRLALFFTKGIKT